MNSKSLEITTVIGCKNACKYCPQELLVSTYKSNKRILSFKDFEKCLSSVPKEVRIDFSGFAEPWLNTECTRMLLHTHQKGHRIAVYTTLVGMDKDDLKKIKNIPFEIFMVHLPDKDSNARINITEKYLSLLNNASNSRVKNIKYMTMGELSPRIEKQYKNKLQPGIFKAHSRAGSLKNFKSIFHEGKIICSVDSWLQHNVLLPNGEVVLCCNDYGLKHILGNLLKTDYDSLFCGREFVNILEGLKERKKYDVLCRECHRASKSKYVYDCFIFFNELDLLEIRLEELNSVVDYFVIVEGTKTFSGKNKSLYYNKNKNRFKKFHHKIIHVIVDDFPKTNNPWDREHHQRNAVKRGLKNCKESDIIILSDVDEIPNPNAIKETVLHPNINKKIFILEQNFFNYRFNCKCTEKWKSACVFSYNIFSTPQKIRNQVIKLYNKDNLVFIKNGGWHFSNLGNPEEIRYKWKSFAHQEYNNKKVLNLKRLQNNIKNANDILNRKKFQFYYTKINNSFPKYLLLNIKKYIHLIKR